MEWGTRSFVKNVWGSTSKAIFGSFTMGIFGIAILVLSLFAASTPLRVLPNEVLATGSARQLIKVDYYLPYPGILPDNPMYKLKTLRDRMTLLITWDKQNKAKKQLSLADKRINAAVALMDGGKMSLGVSTATKGERYLEESVNNTTQLVKEGKDVKSMLLTLDKAVAKHALVLEDLIAKADGNERLVLERTLTSTNMLQEKVAQAMADSK